MRARLGRLGLALLVAFAGGPVHAVPPVTFELVTLLDRPLYVTHAGDGRLFALERSGVVRIVDPARGLLATPFLDLRGLVDSRLDGGAYTLAFHPRYAENGRFFVTYTAPGSGGAVFRSVVERFQVSAADPDRADPASRRTLLAFDQPFASHNTGQLAFGPRDGLLYVGAGDGGSPSLCASQQGESFLGKILRLDVDRGSEVAPYYGIPPDNPFSDPADGSLDEIWALGFRNPWRFSFDADSGDLYIGDVGQGAREEIDRVPPGGGAGANFGWKVMEGSTCFEPDPQAGGCPAETPPCFDPTYTPPHFEYETGDDCAVVGGFVYRGPGVPGLRGRYVFGDVCSGKIWALRDGPAGPLREELADGSFAPGRFPLTSFGHDRDGELYALLDDGVYRLVYAGAPVEISIRPRPRGRPRGWSWLRRKLRVVLRGSAAVDVAQVDLASLAFGPEGARARRARVRDLDRDGHDDLLLQFRRGETGLAAGDPEGCLEGALGGQRFAACDALPAPRPPRWPPRRAHRRH